MLERGLEHRYLSKALLVFVIATLGVAADATLVTTPFVDGFEDYAVGTTPTPPWEERYNANSFVTDTMAFSGNQSYQLNGAYNWSDSVYVDVELLDVYSYEVACLIPSGSGGAYVGIKPDAASNFNTIRFSETEDTIFFIAQVSGPTGTLPGDVAWVLEGFDPDTWYRAVVNVEGFLTTSALADVYIYDESGSLLSSVLDFPAASIHDIGATTHRFSFHTQSHPATTAYFDDFRLTTAVPEPMSMVLLSALGVGMATARKVKRR